MPPNGSASVMLFAVELNGSFAGRTVLVGLELKGSELAAVVAATLFSLAPNRSGSAMPVVAPKGSAEAEKGSSEENGVLEDCLKNESAAKGSESLNGSPPNGSD